jgi:ElaB/YqjD/DUF883 family membrane-anchored ribosome-binding protein
MADQDWKSRLGEGRDTARAAVDALSHSAREAAETARARIGATYGNARSRVDALAEDGRDIAATGLELGSRAAARGKTVVDKAIFSSRGLVAERPLTAVAIGITAGVVLGFLANRLATSKPASGEDDGDEWGV